MADERIDIIISDKINPNIAKNIRAIGTAARSSDNSVTKLNKSLGILNSGAVEKLSVSCKKAAASVDKLKRSEDKLTTSTKKLSSATVIMGRAFAVYATFKLLVQPIIEMADAYTLLQNKLRVVADSQEQVNWLTSQMFEVSARTYSSVEATTKAFQRFDLALSQLGASQEETIRMTETINKSLVLSGAGTDEQTAALLQLSQAFNKGKLDGDEFRSVMELMPLAADAIADELDVVRGELLELAPQGIITAEVMRKAFRKTADDIDGRFSKVIPTVSQSVTVLKNEVTGLFGTFNTGTGASEGLSSSLLELASAIGDTNTIITAFVNNGSQLTESIGKMGKGVKFIIDQNNGLKSLLGLLGAVSDEINKNNNASPESAFEAEMKAYELRKNAPKIINAQKQAIIDLDKSLSDEAILSRKVGEALAVEIRWQGARNKLVKAGVVDVDDLREAHVKWITENERNAAVMNQVNTVYDETTGALTELNDKVTAYNMSLEAGVISGEYYKNKMVELGIEAANLRLQMGEGDFADSMLSSFGKVIDGYDGMLSGMSDSFGSFFDEINSGFADSIGQAIVYSEDLGDAIDTVAKDALASLISSLVKLGVQYVINAALGQSMAAASTATSVALASTTAAAWATPAALTSLASFGANAAPASAGLTSTIGLSNALALAKGYESGGYTGSGGTSDVAGVVHGQEFVVNAAATAENRASLEAMNRGMKPASSSTATGNGTNAPTLSVTVENYGNSEISVQQVSATDVRIIAREVAKQAVADDAPGVIAADLRSANSRTSKSLTQNTNTARRR